MDLDAEGARELTVSKNYPVWKWIQRQIRESALDGDSMVSLNLWGADADNSAAFIIRLARLGFAVSETGGDQEGELRLLIEW